MSLLTEAYEPLIVMNKSVVPDGYGGVTTVYTEGAEIKGALILDSSGSQKIAEALGSTSSYTLTVEKHIDLDFHTILKRQDGTYYRLTSGSDDKKTPESASLNMRQYSAERWEKP